MDRTDVEFTSGEVTCRGWLYRPTDAAGDVPWVVMAHVTGELLFEKPQCLHGGDSTSSAGEIGRQHKPPLR